MNSFQLKCIAVISMMIDHAGAILFPGQMIFRIIGRIAFPIFCFLIVEGYFHTRDVRNYIMRLGAFALLSEIPYDLAFHGCFLEFGNQNVFFLLGLGVLTMYAIEKSGSYLIKFIDVLLAMWAAGFLNMDYGYKGILLILIYYIFHEKKVWTAFGGIFWNLSYGFRSIQSCGMYASLPIALYNGERGPKVKYIFYVFYPVHLIVLYLLSRQGGF